MQLWAVSSAPAVGKLVRDVPPEQTFRVLVAVENNDLGSVKVACRWQVRKNLFPELQICRKETEGYQTALVSG